MRLMWVVNSKDDAACEKRSEDSSLKSSRSRTTPSLSTLSEIERNKSGEEISEREGKG